MTTQPLTLFQRQNDVGLYRVLLFTEPESHVAGGGFFLDVAYHGGGGYTRRVDYYEDALRYLFDELRAQSR